MIKKITLLSLLISINSIAQIKINDFDDAKIYFDGIFQEDSQLDDYGNTYINMGSASSGRVYVRITDVNIHMEERKEEPGCADICPPRTIITLKCRKSNCARDPLSSNDAYESSTIVFDNIKRGKKAFEYLKALKEFFRRNI